MSATRRTILAATLPALSVPALAIDHPDAELLRLGDQLAVVEREWEAKAADFQGRSQAFNAACEHAGLDPDRAHSDFETYNQFVEHLNKLGTLWPEGDSDFDDEAETNKFNDRLYGLIEKILSLKVTTLAGLAVQTRAMVLDNAEFWGGEGLTQSEENDPNKRRQRQFLEAMCSFLGIEPAPICLVDRKPEGTA
jgi:hypothetical protein